MSDHLPNKKRPGRWTQVFSSLSHSQFRWLYLTNMCFMFAMMGQFLVRSILAYDLTESPFALGVLSFVVAIPMLFISPIGGALADRLDRRRLIMLAQILVLVDEVITLILIASLMTVVVLIRMIPCRLCKIIHN